MQSKLGLFGIATLFPFCVFAVNTTILEPSSKLTRSYYTYTVNPDGSFTKDIDYAVTLLKEDALESTKQQSISYSTSVEKVDVIEAYTKKANGKRIDAPKTNFQLEVNSGKDKASPGIFGQDDLDHYLP